MKRVTFLLMLIILSKGVFSQKTVKDNYFGISINEPKNWIVKNNSAFIDSLIGGKVNDNDLAEAIDNNNGSILLATFYKFNPNKGGFVPIIHLNVLNNPSETFEDFKADMQESANMYTTSYTEFSFINEPDTLTINTYKAVYFSGKFTLNGIKNIDVKAGGQKLKGNQNYKIFATTKVYAIPHGNYFFQISMVSEVGNKEDEQIFEALLQSIKIGK